jgi:hypothetical protein
MYDYRKLSVDDLWTMPMPPMRRPPCELIGKPVTDPRVLTALDALRSSNDATLRDCARQVPELHLLANEGLSPMQWWIGAEDYTVACAAAMPLMFMLVARVADSPECSLEVAVVAAFLVLCVYDLDVWNGHHDDPKVFVRIARVVGRLWQHDDTRYLAPRVILRVADVCSEPTRDDLQSPEAGSCAAKAFAASLAASGEPRFIELWHKALALVNGG